MPQIRRDHRLKVTQGVTASLINEVLIYWLVVDLNVDSSSPEVEKDLKGFIVHELKRLVVGLIAR